MKKITLLLITLLVLPFASNATEPLPDSIHDYLITIETEYGDIKMILFDDAPEHKNNFIKLAKAGVYDNIIFHRVIDNFMIQTGDQTTSNKERDYDENIIPETIPAEINEDYKHIYGAVGAAREGDNANPERRSSGTQFYIVENHNGAPHLNGEYTVFGQVMSGLSVVDSVAAKPTNDKDKPEQDIRMNVQVEEVKRSNIEKFYNFNYGDY